MVLKCMVRMSLMLLGVRSLCNERADITSVASDKYTSQKGFDLRLLLPNKDWSLFDLLS
jgi:hypothetical protein